MFLLRRPRVILESPYKGETSQEIALNVEFAKACIRHMLRREEAPFASHLFYTQEGILDDKVKEERQIGIECGITWREVADYSVFYTDRGWSSGMLAALVSAMQNSKLFFLRGLDKEVRLPQDMGRFAITEGVRGYQLKRKVP